MRTGKICTAVMAMALFFATDGFAALPGTVVVEGVLTSSGGGAAADGTYDIVFSVFAAKSGGTPLWTETAKVTTTSGRFHHALGSINKINASVR